MPKFVENVLPDWPVRRDGPWDSSGGEWWGRTWVGGRVVAWEANLDDTITVRHPGCLGLLAAVCGVEPVEQRYRVRLVKAAAAHGGERTWWECPECLRRCGRLYLAPGRNRLGCRLCCGLVYRSQYRPRGIGGRRRG